MYLICKLKWSLKLSLQTQDEGRVNTFAKLWPELEKGNFRDVHKNEKCSNVLDDNDVFWK